MNVHYDQKPYVCDFPGCQKSFRQACKLSRHKQVHKGLETFSDLLKVSKWSKGIKKASENRKHPDLSIFKAKSQNNKEPFVQNSIVKM